MFPILIPDNLSPVVTKADAIEPRFNDTFLENAQDGGFLIDAARVRHPKDKGLSPHCTSYESCMAAFFDCPGPGGLPIGLNGATAGTW